MKVPIYTIEGQKAGEVELSRNVFGVPMNADLLSQVIRIFRARARRPLAHTKDRSEVRGGGRKPWRQKGTGRARHGSIRSPLWRGGGVTFGPRKNRRYSRDLPEAMRKKALAIALSAKARDREIAIVDSLRVEQPKTKLMAGAIGRVLQAAFDLKTTKKKSPTVTLALSEKDVFTVRAARNIPRTRHVSVQNLNAFDVLSTRYIFFPKDALALLERRVQKKSKTSNAVRPRKLKKP